MRTSLDIVHRLVVRTLDGLQRVRPVPALSAALLPASLTARIYSPSFSSAEV